MKNIWFLLFMVLLGCTSVVQKPQAVDDEKDNIEEEAKDIELFI